MLCFSDITQFNSAASWNSVTSAVVLTEHLESVLLTHESMKGPMTLNLLFCYKKIFLLDLCLLNYMHQVSYSLLRIIFLYFFLQHIFYFFLLQLLLQFCLGLSWKRDFNFNVTFSSINKGQLIKLIFIIPDPTSTSGFPSVTADVKSSPRYSMSHCQFTNLCCWVCQ